MYVIFPNKELVYNPIKHETYDEHGKSLTNFIRNSINVKTMNTNSCRLNIIQNQDKNFY